MNIVGYVEASLLAHRLETVYQLPRHPLIGELGCNLYINSNGKVSFFSNFDLSLIGKVLQISFILLKTNFFYIKLLKNLGPSRAHPLTPFL